jgi:hypothetical protein
MSTVTVYHFKVYDVGSDQMQLSRRWATREAIERIRVGVLIESTAVEVDASVINDEGMTELDFDPHRSPGGFPRSVRS